MDGKSLQMMTSSRGELDARCGDLSGPQGGKFSLLTATVKEASIGGLTDWGAMSRTPIHNTSPNGACLSKKELVTLHRATVNVAAA
jgi:hypothetical protein